MAQHELKAEDGRPPVYAPMAYADRANASWATESNFRVQNFGSLREENLPGVLSFVSSLMGKDRQTFDWLFRSGQFRDLFAVSDRERFVQSRALLETLVNHWPVNADDIIEAAGRFREDQTPGNLTEAGRQISAAAMLRSNR